MGFLRKLFNLEQSRPTVDSTGIVDGSDAIWVYLRCDRCGECVAVRLSKTSVLQREELDPQYDWFVNKTVVGNQCFNRMDLRLELDRKYRPLSKRLVGGTFITRAEFDDSKED